MERIVARRVRNCNEDNLQPQRAVFRRARSTLDTLTQVTGAVRRRKGWREDGGCVHWLCARLWFSRPWLHCEGPTVLWRWEAFGGMDRAFSEGARGEGEGGQCAFGGYAAHLWCPSRLVAGVAAVHCHGFFADGLAVVCAGAGLMPRCRVASGWGGCGHRRRANWRASPKPKIRMLPSAKRF
ncbi:hypothetical protein TRVL_03406 [Trypanosoma vivax]|nr:hypothetical protein TRVL_03406 [Trypanosoma vivax]